MQEEAVSIPQALDYPWYVIEKEENEKRKTESDGARESIVSNRSGNYEDTYYKQLVEQLQRKLIQANERIDKEALLRSQYETLVANYEKGMRDADLLSKDSHQRESRKITEDELVTLKTQVRDLKELIEEMKLTDDEKSLQLLEYRTRYLQAQQTIEELKGQIALVELDYTETSDQMQTELNKMKIEFQGKIMELSSLPDILKTLQLQLQEAEEYKKIAEENNQEITNELNRVKGNLIDTLNLYNQERKEKMSLQEINNQQTAEMLKKESIICELNLDVSRYRKQIEKLQENFNNLMLELNKRKSEHEALSRSYCELKEDNAKALTRFQERSTMTRNFFQGQIADIEKQMISYRAQANSYRRERDEVRKRTRLQISTLSENLNVVQIRAQELTKQVSLLKQCYAIALNENFEDNRNTNFGAR